MKFMPLKSYARSQKECTQMIGERVSWSSRSIQNMEMDFDMAMVFDTNLTLIQQIILSLKYQCFKSESSKGDTRFPAPTVQKPLMMSTRTRPFTESWGKTRVSSSRGISFFNTWTLCDTIFLLSQNIWTHWRYIYILRDSNLFLISRKDKIAFYDG